MGRELIERFLRGHINFCSRCSDRLVTKIVFLSRLLPIVSFDIVSYGAGLTRISLKKFAIATFFVIPRVIEKYDPLSLKKYFEHENDR